MLNQKDVSKLIAAMFTVGGSALGYAATTTIQDTTTSTAATPAITTPLTPAVPGVDGGLELETPDVTEAPEVPK